NSAETFRAKRSSSVGIPFGNSFRNSWLSRQYSCRFTLGGSAWNSRSTGKSNSGMSKNAFDGFVDFPVPYFKNSFSCRSSSRLSLLPRRRDRLQLVAGDLVSGEASKREHSR